MVVYLCQTWSPSSSCPPLPLCPHVHSLLLCLYSCPGTRFNYTVFYIYALIYDIYFSLSDLFHSVWQTQVLSTSLQMTQLFQLKKLDHLFCKISYIFDFVDCMPLVVVNKFKSVPCVSCKLIVRAWGLIRFTFGLLVKIPQKYLWVLLIASHWEILSRFSLFVMLRLIKASGIFCLHSKVPIKAGGRVAKTNTEGWSSICGQGTRSHKPQLKILCATTKTWHNQWINSINTFF